MERSTYTGPNVGAECGQSITWFLIPPHGEERIKAVGDGMKRAVDNFVKESGKTGWLVTSVSHHLEYDQCTLILNFVRFEVA